MPAAYPIVMGMTRKSVVLMGVLSLAPSPVLADPLGVVEESGRLAGYAVRDSVETVGWTVHDFFAHGPRTAKYTWRANAARTKADAHAGRRRIVREAHDER
jgi:hypothetical protein